MDCVFRCCAWCGCVSSRYVNNLQHNFDNFETNASKISKENEQLLFPNYVCNENEEGRASSFANLFLWSSLQKRNNTYETVTIQKDSCRVDDFILRQSTLYYLQCMALRAIRHIKKKSVMFHKFFQFVFPTCCFRDAALLKVALRHVRILYDGFLVSTIAVIVERKNEKVVSLVPDECTVMMVNDNAIVLISGRLRELWLSKTVKHKDQLRINLFNDQLLINLIKDQLLINLIIDKFEVKRGENWLKCRIFL